MIVTIKENILDIVFRWHREVTKDCPWVVIRPFQFLVCMHDSLVDAPIQILSAWI